MTEPEFLCELARRAGCQILCDVSNVYLSAHNMHYDARQYLEGLPAAAVGELHLGGFSAEPDEADPGSELLVDTHATRVAAAAWDLYAHALRLFGRQPTLIEWDNDIPPLGELLEDLSDLHDRSGRLLRPRQDRLRVLERCDQHPVEGGQMVLDVRQGDFRSRSSF